MKRVGRLRLGIATGALAAIACLVAGCIWWLEQEHHGEVERALMAGDRSAQKLAVRTAQVLDHVNQLTRLVKVLHESSNPLDLEGLRQAGFVTGDMTRAIYLTDARGFVVASTSGAVPANIADEPDFKRHRFHPGSGMTVGHPIADHLHGGAVIPVMQSLSTKEAGFAGVVVALVDPLVMTREIALGEASGTAVSIVGLDGIVRSRMLGGELSTGSTLDPARLLERAAEMRTTLRPTISPIDKQARFVSVTAVDPYPFLAVVAGSAEALQLHHAQRRDQTLAAGGVVGLLLLVGALVMWTQATQLEKSRSEAREAHALYRGTMDGSLDAVAMLKPVYDKEGRLVDCDVLDVNRVACTLLGARRESIVGMRLCDVLPSLRMRLVSFWRAAALGETTVVELPATDPPLEGRWFQHQIVPIAGGAIGFLTRDITERVIAQRDLAELARVDSLTGLANRRHFEERLNESMVRSQRHATGLALLYMDLDGFKGVNDRLGHDAGDQLLVEVGRRLRGLVRDSDLVARLGGDEFAILCESSSPNPDLAALCKRLLAVLGEPHILSEQQVWATPSVGVARWNGQETPQSLIQRSDKLMYLAKQGGKGRFRLEWEMPEAFRDAA